jgi:integrase
MGYLTRNSAQDVKTPKMNEPIRKGLTAGQVRSFLAAIPDSLSGHRDRAIIRTCFLTGMRRAEVLGHRKPDIVTDPLSGRTMYQVRPKVGQIRHRELPPPAFAAIRSLLEGSGLCWDDLLPTSGGNPRGTGWSG